MTAAARQQLTSRQEQVLAYMREFFTANDQLPPLHTIAKRFGWKSVNAAQSYASILEGKGYIERNAVGKYRFTRQDAAPDAPVIVPPRPAFSNAWARP